MKTALGLGTPLWLNRGVTTVDHIVSFEEARGIVVAEARKLTPGARERVELLEGRGRVLAEAIIADRDQPPFDRATRDGYAVRAADVAQMPVRLAVAGEIRAGAPAEAISRKLGAGEAVAIMTGAPVPPGADAVVMVEHTVRSGELVEIRKPASAGENIVPRGDEARAGAQLVPPGTRVDHAVIALAASTGMKVLPVYARPRVAILATGDELVSVDAQPGPTQIRNSNSYSLAAQVAEAGGCPMALPPARDDVEQLRSLIAQGLTADLLLISGGVSAGKYDLVEDILGELGAEFFFTGAKIQPGKPVVFGRISKGLSSGAERSGAGGSTLFFGLPGNPVSTMVTFELFARPVLEALCGAAPKPLVFSQVRLGADIRTKTGLTRFLPAQLTGECEHSEVEPVRWQGSGDIAAMKRANCYLVVPPDREYLRTGDMVSIIIW